MVGEYSVPSCVRWQFILNPFKADVSLWVKIGLEAVNLKIEDQVYRVKNP